MRRSSREWEEVLSTFHSPHCHTCACSDLEEVSRKVSFIPRQRPRRNLSSRIEEEIIIRDCYCDCHPHAGKMCAGCVSSESLFQFPTTYTRRLTTQSTHPTHSILDRWFRKYDRNGDGYLGLDDLKEIVMNLGGSSDSGSVKRALKEADTDGDGLLSFREFLQMWHQAASHEREFLDATDCQDIVDIVNEYNLFPDVECKECDSRRNRLRKDDAQVPEDETVCNCGGEEEIVPFVQHSKEMSGVPAVKKVKWPLFSCNRLPACIPKNWRE